MITVLTPTYNRAHCLKILADSLINQSVAKFEWLVVDDGSTDNTESIIREAQGTCMFPVRYIYKDNGGKHTALNTGFKEASGEWIFVVDSDDWLLSDCIQVLLEVAKDVGDQVGAISTLRSFPDGRVIGEEFPPGLDNYIRKIEYNVTGDKADLFRKKALQGFSFPVYRNERFMAESVLFIWLGLRYKTKFVNYAGYICKYLQGGLSDKSLENRHISYRSSLYVYECQYNSLNSRILRFKAAVSWWRFRLGKSPLPLARKVPVFYFPFGSVLFLVDLMRFGLSGPVLTSYK